MTWKTKYTYHSLQDFLVSHRLTVDGELDDGWGAHFPVKGIEIEATILFADISGFSLRTKELSPTETLIFVNNYFSWITAEAIKGRPCIVDKYIGDEVMIIFSKEFGSDDPFAEALETGRWMSERDMLDFSPHMGVASGLVTAGYVGTPVQYNCSVFGHPVTVASRCAAIKHERRLGTSIVFPADLWGTRSLDDIFPPQVQKGSEGEDIKYPQVWQLSEPRSVELKNIGNLEIRELINGLLHRPMQTAEDRAKESLEALKSLGDYRTNK